MTDATHDWQLNRESDYWLGRFTAMASPCEVLMEVGAREAAQRILEAVVGEAIRIERKFSRYLADNIVFRISLSVLMKKPHDSSVLQMSFTG